MNLSFQSNYRFTTYESLDTLKGLIEELSNKKWYDLDPNLNGDLYENNEFTIEGKTLFGFKPPDVGRYNAVFYGKMFECENSTHVEGVLKPSTGAVAAFYLLMIFIPIALLDMILRKQFNASPFLLLVGLVIICVFISYEKRKTLKRMVKYLYLKRLS